VSGPNEPRTLPHNLEAERSILGAVLLHDDALGVVADTLADRMFFRDAHKRIYRAMLRLAARNVAIDLTTLREELDRAGDLAEVNGPAYLIALVDGVPRSTNIEHYAAIVREKAYLRDAIFAANKVLAEAYDAEDDAREVLNRAQQAFFDIDRQTARRGFVDMSALMPDVLAAIERHAADRRTVTGVPTGFGALDEMTRGFQPGNLIVVAGRPSMGKTTFAMNIAQHAATNGRRQVAVFSLEMSQKSLGIRLVASEARVEHHRLLSGHIAQGDYARIAVAMDRLGAAGIHIDDSAAVTVFDVRAKSRRLKADGGLDLIVIDYLQLMNGVGRAENKNLEVAGITKGLKAVARDLDVPVVLLSQLSRETERRGNHRPQLSDLRDSGAIEQDADVVIFIHREERYVPTDDNRGVAEAVLSKQRNGPTGTIRLRFESELVRFDNPTMDRDFGRQRA